MTTLRDLALALLAALAALAGTAASPAVAEEADGTRPRVVLVPPFENFSAARSHTTFEVPVAGGEGSTTVRIDRYAHSPRTALEEILATRIGPNFKLIERQRLDQMLAEGEFVHNSMLVDQEHAMRLGQVLGANTVVLGALRSVNEKTREFSGYGIRTSNTLVTAKINIRLLELETMQILASKTFEAELDFPASNFGGLDGGDTAQEVIDAVMEEVAKDTEFLDRLVGVGEEAAAESVEVTFAPRTGDAVADVYVGGEYLGSAPLTVELPAGNTVTVRFSAPGHVDWQADMTPRPGMQVTPALSAAP